ncbi:GNAT family N-acetyltransferase [Streptomyces sp. NPDC001443]
MTETQETQSLLDAYDAQRCTPPPGVAYEYDGPLLRLDLGFRGFVTGPRDLGGLRGREVDELIARQRDFFAARGQAVEWKVRGHDSPADLTDRLTAAGFVPEARETVLIGSVAQSAGAPAVPDGVTVRQVTADADLRRVAALETTVWGLDLSSIADDLIGRVARAPEEIAVFVAEAAGDVVCAAWLTFRPGSEFASLAGGSTLAEWRGRGIYRALLAARAEIAAARGVRHLHVDASDDSGPILRRLGFRAVTTTTPYVWSPR